MSDFDHSEDEIDCAADALRRFEQAGKRLNLWAEIPNSTRNKWREKVTIVLDAMRRERGRVISASILATPSTPDIQGER